MQTIISYTHGASGGDLSDYALKADQEKDVIGGVVGQNSIVLNHRDGTDTNLILGDAIDGAIEEYLSSVQADNADVDSLF